MRSKEGHETNSGEEMNTPWKRCEAEEGGCQCCQIWSEPDDCIVAVAMSKEHTYMEGEGYTIEAAKKHAALIVRAVNSHDALLAACEAALADLERIVCIEGPDRGVIMLSGDSPTHYDHEAGCQVYEHENFSPLGDALIALHEQLSSLQLRAALKGGRG